MLVTQKDCKECIISNESGLCRLHGGWTPLRGRECNTHTTIKQLAILLNVYARDESTPRIKFSLYNSYNLSEVGDVFGADGVLTPEQCKELYNVMSGVNLIYDFDTKKVVVCDE